MKPSIYFKRAFLEIIDIEGCEVNYNENGFVIFDTPMFRIRLIDEMRDDTKTVISRFSPGKVLIHMGEKATFDRWANSVNFFFERDKERRTYYPLFKPQYDWAVKVVKSKLFNFNEYHGRIELPWFKTGFNK